MWCDMRWLNINNLVFSMLFLFLSLFFCGGDWVIFSGVDYHCSKIDYFPKDEYSPDPHDSTMAIPCKYNVSLFHHILQRKTDFN